MHRSTRRVSPLLLLGASLVIHGCSDSTAPLPVPASIELSLEGGLEPIAVGETRSIEVAVTDDGGRPITDAEVVLASSDTTIVVVTGTQVTGVRLGAAVLRASTASLSREIEVEVTRTAAGPGWIEVDAGGWTTSCGLWSTGDVYCWGGNGFGQLGTGSDMDSNLPVRALTPAGLEFTSVRTGANFACALAGNGDVYCWGSTFYGIGSSVAEDSAVPVQVEAPAGVRFTAVDGGFFHACALAESGDVYCWGAGDGFLLGTGNEASSPVPVRAETPAGVTFADVRTSSDGSCALATGGDVYCWGDNSSGGIGNGEVENAAVPTRVLLPAGVTAASLGGGAFHNCAITTTHEVYCWGWNLLGQIDAAQPSEIRIPVQVTLPAGEQVVAIGGGNAFSCATTWSGAAFCWGDNEGGQLGTGTAGGSSGPVAVALPQGVRVDRVGMANAHGCALGLRGEAFCWGSGSSGQLGDGSGTESATPLRVGDP